MMGAIVATDGCGGPAFTDTCWVTIRGDITPYPF